MSAFRTAVLTGVVIGCLFVLAAAASGGAVAAAEITDDSGGENETIPHEHPDEAAGDGDLGAIQGWLNGRMGEIHVDCAEGMVENAFDVCDRLDDDYPEFLKQYVEVERETEADSETSETFEETRDEQEEFAESVEEFRETHEEYREAREAGDEERARELARELLALADRIEASGGNLEPLFADLEERTGFDYEPARNATAETTEEVREIRDEVEVATFTPTELSVRANASSASFVEPVTLDGRLIDDDGTALADKRVSLRVDGDIAATARTDDDGRYAITYRPVMTPTGETTLTVAYEPEDAAPYLGSTASVDVDIQPVTPEIELEETTDVAGFGDEVAASGRVSVDDTGVSGLPVELRIGDEVLVAERTDGDGTFAMAVSLPAGVPDGNETLVVETSRPGLAIAAANAESSIRIIETPTELSVDAETTGDGLDIRGRLVTEDGEAAPGQEVAVRIDGERQTAATTDDEGYYQTTVDPSEPSATGERRVVVNYAGEGSNLAATEAEATVAVEISPARLRELIGAILGGEISPREGASMLAAEGVDRAIALLLLAILALVVAWRHVPEERWRQELERLREGIAEAVRSTRNATDRAPAATDESQPTDEEDEPTLSDADRLFIAARELLYDGSASSAIRTGYAAVRRQLHDGASEADSRTHWEFYRDVRDSLPEDHATALRTVTEAYERAAFAATGVDDATAEEALGAAERCLDEPLATDGGGADADSEDDRNEGRRDR